MTSNQFLPSRRPDVLAALRDATSQRHAMLDAAMPLAAAEPALADYRDHLLLLRAWLAPLETWLAGYDDGPQDRALLAYVERTALIDADLNDIADASTIPPSASGAWPDAGGDTAYRWGVGYVIEGSQLGGAVLYRRLHERLAPHPLRYLHGPAEPVALRWKQFVHAMEQNVTDDAEIARACAGACDAFDRLIELLRRAG